MHPVGSVGSYLIAMGWSAEAEQGGWRTQLMGGECHAAGRLQQPATVCCEAAKAANGQPCRHSKRAERSGGAARPVEHNPRPALCGAYSFKMPQVKTGSLYRCGKRD